MDEIGLYKYYDNAIWTVFSVPESMSSWPISSLVGSKPPMSHLKYLFTSAASKETGQRPSLEASPGLNR